MKNIKWFVKLVKDCEDHNVDMVQLRLQDAMLVVLDIEELNKRKDNQHA